MELGIFLMSFAASIPISILCAVLWLAAAWIFVLHWRASGERKVIRRLESLRFVILTLLVLTLLRPEFVQHLKRTARPEIAVLLDTSASMKTRDVVVTNRATSRAEWLAKERTNQFWKPLEKSAKVLVEDFATSKSTPLPALSPSDGERVAAGRERGVPTDDGTDLNAALESVLKRQRNLKAVLLLTDGDWNLGQSPLAAATRFREQGVPIFSVAVGRETPLPDLVLENVSAPAYGLFGEQIIVPFKVRSNLPRDVKTAVSLIDTNGDEIKKEISIPALGELQESILWSPHVVGEVSLKLQLPVEKDEAIPENNAQDFRINVRVEKLKVLVVDSLPRWEYRYLRNALERDPGVEMHCILFHPGMGMGSGRNYLASFPGSKELLSRYDVIFLGDVGIGQGELSASDAELIKGLVEQQSSGLVFLPGSRGRQLTFLNPAGAGLADLLPVVFDKTKPEGVALQNESNLLLSTAGKRHWLTRFDSDEGRNEELWKQLPGFYWSAAIEKSRPGSEVLAVHSELRNSWGRMPLLVTRAAGSGKVLFMGTDSAWRWRRGVEDKFHYRFWSQVVRWMAHQRHLSESEGMRLSYSPETPQVGDTIFLQASVADEMGSSTGFQPVSPETHGQDGRATTVSGKLISPSGRAEQFGFSAVPGGWGVFKSSFAPSEGGKYKVQVTSERDGRKLETEIAVTRPVREKQGQPVNMQILREISGITHGASASYEALNEIVKQISALPEPQPTEKRIRIWSNPWWGGSILLLLVVYWVGRKLSGLV